jgi:lipoprotein-anchoring transpeptidase ErfK/SrfK
MLGHRLRGFIAFCFLITVFVIGGADISANAAPLVAKVDLSKQTMHVFINGKKRYSWRVSTGKRGWRTPTGRYTPITTYRKKYVKRWGMTLPYAVVIKSSGIAIHGSNGPMGSPRSHGCIRLNVGNAAKFYSLVGKYGKWGTNVVIQR